LSGLRPQPFAALLGRAIEEFQRERRIFDLPRRSFWRARDGIDLSIELHGERAPTPVGPAAGPHTQMAQNLVIAWLAGARVLELKTVQANDRLSIPRPCIDAETVGFNVEWSQELTLEESLEQYAAGWLLIHALAARGVTGGSATELDTVFECSVGYDLAGIRSDRVARFLDGIRDAGPLLNRLRSSLPPGLRPAADIEVPSRLASCATLSTFHGCPPEEIERIVEHLFERHGLGVTVKLNPTLLGYESVEALLRGRLGYASLQLDREAFARDLALDQALPMLARLSDMAARRGLHFGVKLTNTLVVRNPGGTLAGELVYLSGPPLHPIAIALAQRLAQATGGRIPMSFSAGLDADNVADVVACGFAPVTTCTDLLKPTGYRRLPRYLKGLEAAMIAAGAPTIPAFVLARAGLPADGAGADRVHEAALHNLAAYAASVADDPRYHAEQNSTPPRREASRLALLDCLSCNACVVTCPNDAVFAVSTEPGTMETADLVVTAHGVEPRVARFTVARDTQWAIYADFCNACGNCETFCPEHGGPQRLKPRFHGSRESFDAAAPDDGILIEDGGARIRARFDGMSLDIEERDRAVWVSDGVIEAVLDGHGHLQSARTLAAEPGHALRLSMVLALLALRDGVMAGINPVSTGLLTTGTQRRD
jgi:putative selenate reductase